MKDKDFELDFEDELDDEFDFDWDEDLDDDLENLPQEGTPLYNVMKANGILTLDDRERYSQYDSANPGCSKENPIVIDETEDYVRLEYEMLEYLLRPVPFRFVDYELEKQRLLCEGGRFLDVLTLRVFTHPLANFGENGEIIIPGPVFLGTENYWFDITAGYKALGGEVTEIEGEIASFCPDEKADEN